jgi:protein gp37
MAETSKIEWTDSTMNFWEGCQKVGPGCDHCYAEARNVRWAAGANWGPGAPRRRTSPALWRQPAKWNTEADAFEAEHGHPRRVFACSLADLFDNAVPEQWQIDAFYEMQMAERLRWQPLTKRVGNVETMVPNHWKAGLWPRHIGLMITVVTVAEVVRDVPKLLDIKRRFGIPWVGLSCEPLIEDIAAALVPFADTGDLDWIIVGGESGPGSRPYDLDWAANLISIGNAFQISVFHKQFGANPVAHGERVVLADKKGGNWTEWDKPLRVRRFPKALL